MRVKKWRRMLLCLLAVGLLLCGCAAGEEPEPPDPAPVDSVNAEEQRANIVRTGWYAVPVIAHALGTVDGRTGTNSLDAFLASYEAGHRVFEVDLQLTSDGYLIARHDWEQISYYNLEQAYAGVMDLETFKNTPICYYYTPLTIDDLVYLMREYPDIYFVTDSKDTDKETILAEIREISRTIQEAGDPALWDRIIVQIYHEDMYGWVAQEAPVTNWIFTLYQIESPDCGKIGAFCQEHGIPVVTAASGRLSREQSDTLHSYGCLIYIHTVNRLLTMREVEWIVDGFYSDYVSPTQLEAVRA
ncbi:MAG: hypothetical protein K2N78_01820, partial [Oscillospiraceae bacterium]|nr:hypothetical protein [Oscillospiraceae bacterium]